MAQRDTKTTALHKLLVICRCLWLDCKLAHIFWPLQGHALLRELVMCLKSNMLTFCFPSKYGIYNSRTYFHFQE